ncbi:MAG: PBECR4 domain-containing protein [Christensenellaceae bacterium]
MDKLYEIAKFYKENLENRTFCLKAGKSGVVREWNIQFTAEHFHHLAGLKKLTDIPKVQEKRNVVYSRILNKKITIGDIRKSQYYSEMEMRLLNFQEIADVLFSKELMIRSLHGNFNKIQADFMLTKTQTDKGEFFHLFFKERQDGISSPVTFVIHPNNSYIRNNPNKWTVLSIDEITKKPIQQIPTPTKAVIEEELSEGQKKRTCDFKRLEEELERYIAVKKAAELKSKLELKTGRPMKELQEEVRKFHGRTDKGRNQGDEHDR